MLDPAASAPARPVCLLGMHRSGTSFLAGSLERAGLRLGRVSEWNEHNRRGNRENPAVVALNDAVLAANGGSWDRPPARVRWTEEQLSDARRIVRENLSAGHWGFKDPRSLLTLPGWQAATGGLQLAGTFRHPLAVARSLQERALFGGTRMTTGQCLDLWLAYNRRLLELHAAEPFPVISFDWEPERLERGVDRVAAALGLAPPPRTSGDERFLAPELRRHVDPGPAPLPDEVSHTYVRLVAIAESQETP